MPRELPTARTLGTLLEPARAQQQRISFGSPPPCQPITEEEEEEEEEGAPDRDPEAGELAELRAMIGHSPARHNMSSDVRGDRMGDRPGERPSTRPTNSFFFGNGWPM